MTAACADSEPKWEAQLGAVPKISCWRKIQVIEGKGKRILRKWYYKIGLK
jgi:hypothetical protein